MRSGRIKVAIAREVQLPKVDITAESLRQIFERAHIVRGSARLPSRKAFNELAQGLTFLRNMIPQYAKVRAEVARGARVRRAILILAKELGAHIEWWETPDFESEDEDDEEEPTVTELPLNTIVAGERLDTEAGLQALRQLLCASQAARKTLWPEKEPDDYELIFEDDGQPIWHELASSFAQLFWEALKSTNSGLDDIPYSNTGALSRFVEAIIPLVTGEEAKGETVMRHLQRRRSGYRLG